MGLLSTLFSEPWLFVAIIVMFLIALSFHEFAHALAGYWLGDSTAEREGRLTLNPFAHVDPWGFAALVTLGFGWGKPVPFNPYNIRYPRWGPVFVALAGPASNGILGLLFLLLVHLLFPLFGNGNLLIIALSYGAYLNFLLMIFNLIPLAPLDGSRVLIALFADERYRAFRSFIETKGPTILLVLIAMSLMTGVSVFGFVSSGARFLMQVFGG